MLPFIVTFVTLGLMYMVVPNRRVRWQEAAIGALLGALRAAYAGSASAGRSRSPRGRRAGLQRSG